MCISLLPSSSRSPRSVAHHVEQIALWFSVSTSVECGHSCFVLRLCIFCDFSNFQSSQWHWNSISATGNEAQSLTGPNTPALHSVLGKLSYWQSVQEWVVLEFFLQHRNKEFASGITNRSWVLAYVARYLVKCSSVLNIKKS